MFLFLRQVFIAMSTEVVESVTDEGVESVLIDLVQAELMLWNMGSDVYSKTKTKSKDLKWKEIAQELNIDGKYIILITF